MKSYSIFKNCLYRVVFLYKVYKILCQMHGLSGWRFYYSFILKKKKKKKVKSMRYFKGTNKQAPKSKR